MSGMVRIELVRADGSRRVLDDLAAIDLYECAVPAHYLSKLPWREAPPADARNPLVVELVESLRQLLDRPSYESVVAERDEARRDAQRFFDDNSSLLRERNSGEVDKLKERIRALNASSDEQVRTNGELCAAVARLKQERDGYRAAIDQRKHLDSLVDAVQALGNHPAINLPAMDLDKVPGKVAQLVERLKAQREQLLTALRRVGDELDLSGQVLKLHAVGAILAEVR